MRRLFFDRRIRREILVFLALGLGLRVAGFWIEQLGVLPFWRIAPSDLPLGPLLLPPYVALLLVIHALARCGRRNWIPIILLWALSPLAAMVGAFVLLSIFGRFFMAYDAAPLIILLLYPPLIGTLTARAIGAMVRAEKGESAGAPWRWGLSGALIGVVFTLFGTPVPLVGMALLEIGLPRSLMSHGWTGHALVRLLFELMQLACAVLAMLPLYLRPAAEPRPAAGRGFGFRLTFCAYALAGLGAAGLWVYESRILTPIVPALYGLTPHVAPDCPPRLTAACVDRWMTANAAWLMEGRVSSDKAPDKHYAGGIPPDVALRQARMLAAAGRRDVALARAEAALARVPDEANAHRHDLISTPGHPRRHDDAVRGQLAILVHLLRGEPPQPPPMMRAEALAEALPDVRMLADAQTSESVQDVLAARNAADPRRDVALAAARDDAAAAEALLAAGRPEAARIRAAAIGDANFRRRWLGGDPGTSQAYYAAEIVDIRLQTLVRLAIAAARRGEDATADAFLRLAEADGLAADRLFDARLDAALALAVRAPEAARAWLAPVATGKLFRDRRSARPVQFATASAFLGRPDPATARLLMRDSLQLPDIAAIEQRLDIGVPVPPDLADAVADGWRALFRTDARNRAREAPFAEATGQWDIEYALAWHRVLRRIGREAEWSEGWREAVADLDARSRAVAGRPGHHTLRQEAEMIWISLIAAEAADGR